MTLALYRWLRGAAVIAAVAYGSVLLYWTYPYLKARLFNKDAILEEPEVIETWPEAAALREALRRKFLQYKPEELKHFKGGILLDGRHLLNPLVEAVFVVGARPVVPAPGKESLQFEHRTVDARVRGERLIWGTAILALIVLLAWDLWKPGTGGEAAHASRPEDQPAFDLQGLDLPNLLNREIQHCQGLCDQTYSRSTLLLRAAIVTAIGGFGALNFLPSPEEAATRSNDLWVLLTRSYGVLLVVNALALVLLRQYRSSADDFRYMVNLRWRRVSLLAASLDGGKREQVTKALLAEPYPEERLRGEAGGGRGDSTEGTEIEGGILATTKRAFKREEDKEK